MLVAACPCSCSPRAATTTTGQWERRRRRQVGWIDHDLADLAARLLDPALRYTVNGIEPLWLVYTPLLTYKHAEGEEGLELIPGVAEALPTISKDGKTYELTLRKGLKYSDGSPVKASDLEHAIKRVLNLESGGSAFLPDRGAQDYLEAGKADADIPGMTRTTRPARSRSS